MDNNIATADVSDLKANDLPGIVAELGKLGPGAVLFEEGFARLIGKHPISLKRAVKRGEIPPPVHWMGKPAWTVGAIIRHLDERLATAAQEAKIILNHRD